MRRSVTVVLVLMAFFLSGRFWSSLPITAQGIDGEPVATCNGDVNGDKSRDLTDAIYMLNWLFSGGPEPVALACESKDSDLGKLLAGGWVFEYDPSRFGFAKFPSVTVLSAEGGLVQVGRKSINGVTDLKDPGYGSWEATGARSFVYSVMSHNFDPAGDVLSVTRVDVSAELDEVTDEINGTFVFTLFAADVDPLDPASQPFLVQPPAPMSARRLVPRGVTF